MLKFFVSTIVPRLGDCHKRDKDFPDCLHCFTPSLLPQNVKPTCCIAQARNQGAQPGSRETSVQHSSVHAPPCQQHHAYMMQQGTLQHDMARHRGAPDLVRADLDMYDSPLRHSHFERPILQIRQSHDLQVLLPFITRSDNKCLWKFQV